MSDHLSQSSCLEMLLPKTNDHVKPSVEVNPLVGKLSTAETLLTEVKGKVPTCPGKHLLKWYTYIGKDFMLTLFITVKGYWTCCVARSWQNETIRSDV